MNPKENVLDSLGNLVADRLSSPWSLEELENGDSSSTGGGWGVGFMTSFPHMGPRHTVGEPSVRGIFLRDPGPYFLEL